ncbi:cell division protein ZipA [Oceanimonas baumannii]|uniref:Cell division protein ZipA n=2 Tax=Oceanimonas baumannii TaxID=129578 RepID=A0A235CPH7_9GAMM|nr:cell division protein ZipA [Oceanimonas baumannii]TDW60087.1 cell division protein ZipA [Oceanimonas baumannii]
MDNAGASGSAAKTREAIMQDLRIILIILGAMAIAALLIHGLWSSKKDRQPSMRDKPMDKVASDPASEDSFDQDGIGQVRVASANNATTEQDATADDWREEPRFSALDDDDEPVRVPEPPAARKTAVQPQPADEDEFDPLFGEPVRPKQAVMPEAEAEPAVGRQFEAAEQAAVVDADAEQPEPQVQPEPVAEPEPLPPLREVPRTWQDVYVINLMARPNQQIDGTALMRALTSNGFHFGEMDIFHHHQTPAGQGSILFSLINMMKPGTFNPKEMIDFRTPGVSIFMQLPRPGMAKNQFNLMVQTAENLAEELDALLFDAQRSPVSPDYLAHCREQLRDYDSQVQ